MTFIKSGRSDHQRRVLYALVEWKRQSLKSLLNDKRIPLLVRLQLLFHYESFLIMCTNTRIRNRCIWTSHGRAVLRPFRLSRYGIKEFGSQGMFPGFRLGTW